MLFAALILSLYKLRRSRLENRRKRLRINRLRRNSKLSRCVDLDNPEATKTLINALRAKGVRIALDDFGIGMSNFERLLEYPIEILKIDRSYVQSPTRESRERIMRGLGEMSKTMGFEIVAEGIETQGQLDFVRAAGITDAQGYFPRKPQTADYWLEETLRRRSQKTTFGLNFQSGHIGGSQLALNMSLPMP